VIRIANARSAEGFVAVSAEARKKFWLDRARTAAIARHTNAFKINEDVVIPLERLGDYTDGIERLNIELSLSNKLKLCDALAKFVEGPELLNVWGPNDETRPPTEEVAAKVEEARDLVAAVRARWQGLYGRLDASFPRLQDRSVVCSWKTELKAPLEEIFGGRNYAPVMARCIAIQLETLRAGCSSPCTCTPATATCTRTSPSTPTTTDAARGERSGRANHGARPQPGRRHLGRARDRHHQARIPDAEELAPFAAYKAKVDPQGRFNARKLLAGADLSGAYTPSFSLIGHESLILEASRIGRSRRRSRTACAAASASRCARRTSRRRTCSIRRATRSSRRRC
jgi:FAD/FMN-containing dehydrogenase